MTTFLLAKRDQQLLVYGYVRRNLTNTIPNVLNHICVAFYNENIYMNFNGDKLQKFLTMKNRSAIYSKTFRIMGFLFCCSICPNGWIPTQLGKTLFYLECKSAPPNVKIVSIICKMRCAETETIFQKTNTIKITPNSGLFCQWHNESLYLCDCMNKNKLEFICHVEILNIKYKHGNEYHKNGIILQSKCNTEWTIDKQKLKLFKSYIRNYNTVNVNFAVAGHKCHFGPMIDDNNWSLY
eukprot:24425_1